VASGRSVEVRRVLLPPRVPEELTGLSHAGDPIEVLIYRPQGITEPRPLVLLSPVLANSGLLVKQFATRFAREGWNAAIVYRIEFEFDPKSWIETAEPEMRLLVMRSRQALDWLVLEPGVDPSRVATFGVSAGAVVSAVLAGSGPRFVGNVVFLGGGPLADVMADTTEDRFLRYGRAIEAETGATREETRALAKRTFRSDPILLAPRVPRETVLMLIARNDRSVPARTGYALWEALDRPRLVETPLGHHTTFALLPWIEGLAIGFLRERFGTPPGGGGPPPVVR
jgi:dienelactone hydrolase